MIGTILRILRSYRLNHPRKPVTFGPYHKIRFIKSRTHDEDILGAHVTFDLEYNHLKFPEHT